MSKLVAYLSEHDIPMSFWKQLLIPLSNKAFSVCSKLAYINGMIDTHVSINPELSHLKNFPIEYILTAPTQHKKRKIVEEDDNIEDDNIEDDNIDDSVISIADDTDSVFSDTESIADDQHENNIGLLIGEIYKEIIDAKTTRFFRIDKTDENTQHADITWIYSYTDMISFFDSRKLQSKCLNIKANYHANMLWISTHKQQKFLLGKNIECIKNDIVFKQLEEKRQSQRGKYQICEVFDIDTLETYEIPMDADGICWMSRFDGYIDNLLARGLQNSSSDLTSIQLKKMLSDTPKNEFKISQLSSPIKTQCDICSMQRHIKETLSLSGNSALNVGSACKEYLITAHQMLHYKDYELNPRDLEKQFTPS